MNLAEFEIALEKATYLKNLNEILKNYLKIFDISTYAFSYYTYHPISQNKLKYDCCSENFSLWHKHYLDEGYEDIDSTLPVVYKATLPIYWELSEQLENAKSDRERQMRLDSIAFGAEKGLSIPIHGPEEDFAILLLVQMQGERCLQDWQLKKYQFLSLGYCFYHQLQKKLIDTQTPELLNLISQREMQCLQLLAKRCSVAAIAKELMISERTVNFHIQRVNKKLGVKNKYQAVNKALQKGIINL